MLYSSLELSINTYHKIEAVLGEAIVDVRGIIMPPLQVLQHRVLHRSGSGGGGGFVMTGMMVVMVVVVVMVVQADW
jgi:hypothetical protein